MGIGKFQRLHLININLMPDFSYNFKKTEIKEVLSSISVEENVFRKLCALYKAGGCDKNLSEKLARETIRIARKSMSLDEVEGKLRQILNKPVSKTSFWSSLIGKRKYLALRQSIIQSFSGRSERMVDQIKKWISGRKILDFGSGSGHIGKIINQKLGKDVVLTDIVNYNRTNLPFILFDNQRLPVGDQSFDTLLFLVVLHHSENQSMLLQEAKRVAKRIIVIETVYEGAEKNEIMDSFGETAFFDWFYNRVILFQDVPVCYNFRMANEWIEYFRKEGFEVKCSQRLGQDHPTLFLTHHLFVLESI